MAVAYPKLGTAFKKFGWTDTDANATIDNIIGLNIPNLNNLNPAYTSIAYFILSNLSGGRNFSREYSLPANLLVLSGPDEELRFAKYGEYRVDEMLNLFYTIDYSDTSQVIKHLENLLPYISLFLGHMSGDVANTQEERVFIDEDDLDEEEEFEYEEDED